MVDHAVASREEWIAARKEMLAEEKRLTRLRDELDRRRRELPWVKVEKEYAIDLQALLQVEPARKHESEIFLHFVAGSRR